MYKCNCSSCKCMIQKKSNSIIEQPCNNNNLNKSIFPSNPMLAQSYVPIQYMDKTFTPDCALKNGTIFPELVNTYYPGQSMMDIDYIKMVSNQEIGSEV